MSIQYPDLTFTHCLPHYMKATLHPALAQTIYIKHESEDMESSSMYQ